MSQKVLSVEFNPLVTTLELAVDASLIDSAEAELTAHAKKDANGCYGYFPGMQGKATIDFDLPACKAFASQLPKIKVEDKTLSFNFLRLSIINQPAFAPFHLDSDAATAITGNRVNVSQKLVWRLLLNLSKSKLRTVLYLNKDALSSKLKVENGYVAYAEGKISPETIQSVELSPRHSNQVTALLFCASRVFHAGKDIDGGHFIGGYGVEE